jgi:hypothetical protein
VVVLHVSSPAQESYARRRRIRRRLPGGPRPGCVDPTVQCPEVFMARVSLPGGSRVPVVDSDERFATDVCGASAYEATATGGLVLDPQNFDGTLELRDADGDDRLEAVATVRWQTTPICVNGTTEMERVAIVDLESSRPELGLRLLSRDQTKMGPHTRRRLLERDLDGDGRGDIEVQTAVYLGGCAVGPGGWPAPETPLVTSPDALPFGGEDPWANCAAFIERTPLLYHARTDRWIPQDSTPSSGPLD